MDTHDTNLPLEEGKLEEAKKQTEETNTPVAEATAVETTSETVKEEAVTANKEETATQAYTPKNTKEEVVARLKEIAESDAIANKQELDALKQNFYKLHKADIEAARAAFIEAGGTAETFITERDPMEDEYKNAMSVIKQQRNEFLQKQEEEKEEKLKKKLSIIERLKAITEGTLDANTYNEVKQMQQEWKEIKNIPAGKINEVWKSYQLYTEKYYDLLKLNNEFREYDFKKNLAIKTRICEDAEKLVEEKDIISAFRKLQKLHQEYRETGPVAKDLREETWTRFKNASTEINKKHQSYFEEQKEAEQNNLDQKTVICEIVEATEYDKLTSFTLWEEKTKEILALQAKWKTIGYAPQKMNVKIFERFRSACDNFFNKKAEYFKVLKENMNENLEKKKALCEKAEALKDSTDWKETAEILTKLQKEWKTIGPISRKHSDAIWKRFIGACDYFFDQKGKATSSQRSVENENLEKKKAIIAQLTALDAEEATEEAGKQVRDIMQEWNSVGHVPFKEKDKIYKEYSSLIDNLFDKLNLSTSQKRLNNFRSNIGNSGNSLSRERDRLVRAYENMKNEILTYENNIGFLSSSSKKGNSLVAELNRKIEKLKGELLLIQQKIDVIDEQQQE